jgi:hypothetical protein
VTIFEAIRLPLIMAMAANVIVVLPLLAVVAGGRLVRRDRIPGPLRIIGAISVGFGLGSAVLVTDDLPALRLAAIGAIVGTAVVAVTSGRVTVGGALVSAAGLPWLVDASARVLDALFGGPVRAGGVIPPLIVSAATVGFGILMIRFQRDWDAAHPPGASPSPVITPRRWDELSRRVFGTGVWTSLPVLAAVTAFVAVALVTGVATHGWPFLAVVPVAAAGAVIGAVLLGAAIAFGRSAPSRRALEAFVWLSETEYERISKLAGRRVRPSLADLRRFAAQVPERPDNRWIRVELLVADGDLVSARAMALLMPEATPFERLERAAHLVWLDWIEGRDDDSALGRAAAELDAGSAFDQARAEVILAIAESRRRIAAKAEDPLAPLREARDRLGRVADGAIWQFIRRTARNALPTTATLVTVVLLLDRIGRG